MRGTRVYLISPSLLYGPGRAPRFVVEHTPIGPLSGWFSALRCIPSTSVRNASDV